MDGTRGERGTSGRTEADHQVSRCSRPPQAHTLVGIPNRAWETAGWCVQFSTCGLPQRLFDRDKPRSH